MQDNKKEKENTQELSVGIEVTLLDGRLEKFCLSERCLGQELFTLVIKKIGFFEYEYFGLLYTDFEGNRCWIDNNKPLTKVLRNSSARPLEFLFAVKFFTPYPNLLEDDLTRYLYALQIRNDFFQGLLHSNRNTSLLLAAFIAQSQLGDFQETECRSYAYLKKHHMFRTAPDSYLMRLMELHQTLIGITKSEADYRLLDAARKVELYGIRLHAAKSMEDRTVNMGVNHIGIMIFEKFSRVNTFNWSMIRKLSFKRRKLLLKLHMEAYGYGNDTIEFSFPTRNSCKNFWKKCIEQHTFFRSISPYDTRQAGTIHRGSSVFSHSSPGNLFTFPFTKLRRSASCGANTLSNSRGTYKRADEENSETSNRKSSQTSHLSTPVKRFAHLNLTGSSFHYTGRTQKQLMESDPEHLKFSSEYNSSSLKVNPYCDDGDHSSNNNRTASMRKKSHLLTKLLAQKYPLTTGGGFVGGGSDHFELFRLSFTSLIPYPSSTLNSNNNGNNNNDLYDNSSTLYGKSGFKWNCNRAVSTSSIDRQVSSCRRKVSTHSYVPRHFSGTISRQSSVSQDVHTIDWSDSKYYNGQSTYTNHLTKRPSEGCLSKSSTNMFKPCVNESPNSSSCSLTSESYPRPVSYDEPIDHPQYLLTSKSDLSNLQITELDYSADEKDTSPLSVISTKQNLKNCTYAIQSPLMTSLRQFGETELSNNHQELLDKENYSGSHESLHRHYTTWDNDHQQKITSPATENDADSHVSLAEVKEDIKSVDRYSADDHQDIDDNVSETHSPYQVSLDNFEAFSQDDDAEEAGNEKYDEEDKTSQCRSQNDYAPNGNVSMDTSLVDLQSLGKSHDNSLFNSSIVFSEEISLDGNKSRLLSTTDIAHSELIDDLESDIQSDQYVHMDEAPESLADAISLGAISLITGLSEDDEHDPNDGDGDGDDDGRRYNSSKAENILNVNSVYLESDNSVKVKHAKSLTHLPRREVISALTLDSSNINAQGIVESDKQSLNEPTCKLVRVKSQQIFSNTDASFRQHRHQQQQMEAESSAPSVMLSTPTLNGTANQVDQKTYELLKIASGCLDIFKEVLLTETMYNHDLEFLLAAPLDIANSLHVIPLINWLQNRLLPAVKPIYDRQVSLLHQLKITVSTLKRLISRVKLLSKQVFSKSKDNDGDGDNDDDDDDGPMRHLFPSSVKINHDSLISMHHISKSCVSSSELSLSHTTTTASHVNEIEELSTSEISSCRLSPQFIKHKHKKCALHAILKELQNLSCCINLLMNLLDQLQCYEAWIKNSVNLLTELWLLAFSDVLSSHPNKDTETANNRLNGKSKTQITDSDDNNNSKTTENIQPFSDEYSPTLIRKVLHSFEEESSSLGSIWHYLLLPSRRFRSYCHLLQSLVDQLSLHSCSVLCKAVFSHFLLTCRSLDTTLDQAERVALAFQLSVIVFPLEKFFFTSDETIQNHINMSTGDKEDQQNAKLITDECRMKDAECNDDDYGDDVVADRLQGISTCLLHSLTTYPLIRFGWLNKYSRRGFQPRLIFLFTDRLIYASRIRGVLGLYLKLHGILSLANTIVERNIPHKNHDSDYSLSDENKQSVYLKFGLVVTYATRSPIHKSSEEPDSCVLSRNSEKSDHRRHMKSQSPCRYRLRKHRKRFIFGVPNQSDYETWINDISRLSEDNKTETTNEASAVNDSKMFNSVQMGKYSGVVRLRDSCTSKLIYSQVAQRCIKNTNTCQYHSDSGGLQTTSHKSTLLTSSYKNNLVEFCWRQHSSISCIKLLNIIDDEMSGYLFRLSKRGTGSRQKLWAILSDLCLKFYKTYHHYKLLARLWLSSDKCTIELITLNSLPFEHDSTGVDCEHHRHKRRHHHQQQQRQRYRHHVVYGQAIKISHNSKDYYFQAENEFLLKRWYNSILNVLNCSTSERGQIENTLTDDDLALVNESISTSCLSTTPDAKLIFTCRSVSSEKPKEQFEVNNE